MTAAEITAYSAAIVAILVPIGDRALKWRRERDAHEDGIASAKANAEVWARDRFATMFDEERAKRDDVTSRFAALNERVGRNEAEVEHVRVELVDCQRQHADCREETATLRADLTDLRSTISVIKPVPGDASPDPKGSIV